MNADGFLGQRQRHPFALAAAVTINVAAITALMLAKADFVPPIEGILIGRNIPIVPPPPPTPPEAQPKAERPNNPVFVPKPRVPSQPIESDTTLVSESDVIPIRGTGDDIVIQPRVEPSPTPTPLPILTEAVPLPSAMREFQPPYPPQLLRTGVEGKAVVRVLIGTDGRVKQVAVIGADDPLFADATERQALRRWRFKPATRDGSPVEVWKQLTVRFEIH